jgi:hypothetical protein
MFFYLNLAFYILKKIEKILKAFKIKNEQTFLAPHFFNYARYPIDTTIGMLKL